MAKQTKRSSIEVDLSRLALVNERSMQIALQIWMNFVARQVGSDLTTKYIKALSRVVTELSDWEFIESEGVKELKPVAMSIMKTGGDAAYKHLALTGSFDVLNVQAVRAVNKYASKLVREVTAETKKGINVYIKHGIKEGHSMRKIARNLRPLVGLTERQTQSVINFRRLLEEKRPDLSVAQTNKRVMSYTNKTHRLRMENIARTETARAQNIGYIQGLEQIGVKEAQFQISPNACEAICVPLDGTIYPISEAAGIIPAHPRCACAMLPVIDDKAISNILSKPPSGIGE